MASYVVDPDGNLKETHMTEEEFHAHVHQLDWLPLASVFILAVFIAGLGLGLFIFLRLIALWVGAI